VSIVTESIPQTTVGTGLAFQFQGTGGTGSYTWTLIYAEGNHGLTVSPSGYFNATNPQAGLWQIGVELRDSANNIAVKYFPWQVNSGSCVIDYFYASPTPVASGQTTTLYWGSKGCSQVALYATNYQFAVFTTPLQYGTSGSYQVPALYNTAYYRVAGTASGSPDPTQSSARQDVTIPVSNSTCVVSSFYASPSSVSSGQTTTLFWNATGCGSLALYTTNAQHNSFSTPIYLGSSGSLQTSALYGTAYYRLAGSTSNTVDPLNATSKQDITVSVGTSTPCSITSFYASPSLISSGKSSTLYWSTSGCSGVALYSMNPTKTSFSQPLSYSQNGSYVVSGLYGDAYYRLVASSSGSIDPISSANNKTDTTIYVNGGSNNCAVNYFTIPDSVSRGTAAFATWGTTGCNWVRVVATNENQTQRSEAYGKDLSGKANLGNMVVPGTHWYAVYASSNANATYDTAEVVTWDSIVVPNDGGAYYSNPPRNVLYNGTVYLTDGIIRQAYTSAGAFLSYSFNNWYSVVPATPQDLALPVANGQPFIQPRNGSLINDHGTVYIISNGVRMGFSSADVFLAMGYSFGNVMAGDTSFMVTFPPINSASQRHPWGTVVNQNGTLYYLSDDDKWGVPDMATFFSWGLKLEEVVTANQYDRNLLQTSVLQYRSRYSFGI
jgi:hypothetical protein